MTSTGKTIEPIKLNWEEFEEKIEEEKNEVEEKHQELKEKNQHGSISNLWFRGQANKDWKLETTLERYSRDNSCVIQEYSEKDYYNILQKVRPAVLSLTSENYELPKFEHNEEFEPRAPQGYEFMVYLRHHGFPSPLLDWTRSPYVAAFFAFHNEVPKSDDGVAIFSFREFYGEGKTFIGDHPIVRGLGPYLKTHERHYRQQCEYTIAIKKGDGGSSGRSYICHEDVKFGPEQDILKKYIIPSSERNRVLKKLDLMNINEFSLFGNEEGLMSMLAFREIERR